MSNVYDEREQELARVLGEVPDDTKRKVEKSINKQIKAHMKTNKKDFLNVEDILEIKELKKYLKFVVFNGPRLIGKSYSTKYFLLKRFREHDEKFVWIRNTDAQAEKNLKNDSMFWKEFGYHIFPGSRAVVSLIDDKKSVNDKNVKKIVGWYIGLSTAKNSKSIDYKGAYWINFEEFNDGSSIKDKWGKFTSLASSIFRLNDKAKVLLSSNMISQSDNVLATMGMNQKKGVNKLLTFNWALRSMIWNIPKNHYKKTTGGFQVARRMALVGSIELWKSEYGGEFSSEYANNIKTITSFKDVVDKFIIRYDTRKLMVCYDTKTKEHYVVDWERRRKSNVREFVVLRKDELQYKQSKMIPPKVLKFLNIIWKREILYTDEISIAELMIEFLDQPMEKSRITNVINKK